MSRMPPPPHMKPPSAKRQSDLLKQALSQGHPGSMSIGTVPEEGSMVRTDPVATSSAQEMPTRTWKDYWTSKEVLQVVGRGSFNVYLAGQKGPLILCLHGAGYTGLTWSLLTNYLKDDYRVAAPDLRNHGLTTTISDEGFSKEVLVQDVIEVLKTLLASPSFATSEGPLPVMLVGHSMGGGLAVWVAAALEETAAKDKLPLQVAGAVVIDVVEGTALAALPHMVTVLNSRPASFPSVGAAIAWARRSGMCKEDEAAEISLPSQLKEEDGRWVWRTNLHSTQPYWEGWYLGLSERFLALRCPKMLILAGTDRLDRTLTIGQMQGKFQLVLLPTAGHAVQEDQHDSTAQRVLDFLKRFRVGLPLVPLPRAAAGIKPVLPVVAGPPL